MKISLHIYLVLLLVLNQSQAQVPFMVKDINSLEADLSSSPLNFLKIGTTIYFSAYEPLNNRQFWKTDGTEASTTRITAIDPAFGIDPQNLTAVNSMFYFTSYESSSGRELWKSDGTAAGTVLVKNINTGGNSSTPANLVNVNGTLFFSATNATNGIELWKSDGTNAGTVMVKDIYSGAGGSNPQNLININGTLFFTAIDATNGTELWKSDGTAAGTVMVKDIYSGSSSSDPVKLAKFGSNLFFFAADATNGKELWKSDGTTAGTVLVKDINPGTTGSQNILFDKAYKLTEMNGFLYFTAEDPTNGYEFWRTDGTTAGTAIFKDIIPGSGSSRPQDLTNINGTLYFGAYTFSAGVELWKSDGTVAGTVLVKDIESGTTNSYPINFTANNGQIYFTTSNGIGNGSQLWKTDGTTAGTVAIIPNSSAACDNLTLLNNLIYFTATGPTGREVYKTDGTQSGTVVVKEINKGNGSSGVANITNLNGTIFFTANDGVYGNELWKTDGTTTGTSLFKDFYVGFGGSGISNLTNINGTLFFALYNFPNYDLWKSDGTVAGTVLVKAQVGSSGNSARTIESFTNVNGTLFFVTTDGNNNNRKVLWKSDGTTAGTVGIRYFNSDAAIENLTNVNGTLFFSGLDNVNSFNKELWKSNGTFAGTIMVKEINPNTSIGSSPQSLINFNGTLYFSADDGVNGSELWKSDGTDAGTVMVKDIFTTGTGYLNGNVTQINIFNGFLYFSGRDNANDYYSIWKSDGTAAGTTKLRQFDYFYSLSNFKGAGSTLYFVAPSLSTRSELWKTDGTVVGTVLVKDIYPGTGSGYPRNITVINNLIYFVAEDGVNGLELWKSDGSAAGTVMVRELHSNNSTYPSQLININGTLFFTAETNRGNSIYGNELWRIGDCTTSNNSLPTSSLTNYFNSQVQTSPATSTCFCDEFNNLVSTVNAVGASPIAGNMSNKAWLDNTQDVNFVKRHYEITPTANPTTATAKVTLYYTQQDFNDFNALSPSDLPTGASDLTAIPYIRIEKRSGSSNDGSGLPSSYTGTIETIDPADANIVKNPTTGLWEISFDVTGFSGFFLKSLAPPCAASYTLVSNSDDYSTGTIIKEANATTGTITATNKITGTANVTYRAGKSIQLEPGFKADNGVVFKTEFGGCN